MTLKELLHKRWHKKLLEGVEMIKLGLIDRLTRQYQPVYGRESAYLLAAAVVNGVFHHQPADHLFLEFNALNHKTIKREIKRLLQDQDLHPIICEALRVQAAELTQDPMANSPKEFESLTAEEETLPPQTFLEMAREFQEISQ